MTERNCNRHVHCDKFYFSSFTHGELIEILEQSRCGSCRKNVHYTLVFRVSDDDLVLLTGSISFTFIDGKHAGKVTGTRNMDFIEDANDLAGADMASSSHFLERKVLTQLLEHDLLKRGRGLEIRSGKGALLVKCVTTAAYIASLAIQEMQLFMEKWKMFDEARIVALYASCSGLAMRADVFLRRQLNR